MAGARVAQGCKRRDGRSERDLRRAVGEAVFYGLQQPFAVENRQDMQLGSEDLVDQAIAVDKALTDVLLAEFGDHSTQAGLFRQQVRRRQQRLNHPLRIMRRVPVDILGDFVDILQRRIRLDQSQGFSHLLNRSLASSCPIPLPCAIDAWPCLIFSST